MMMNMVTLVKFLRNNNLYLETGKKILSKFFLNVSNMILNLLNLIITFKIKMQNRYRSAMISFLIIS